MSAPERTLKGPEIEVAAKAARRRFTVDYKRTIVREAVTKTHSRPHVSNDNPFSEAQFKTLKYRPTFPTRFGSIQDARAHCHVFFPWYNTEAPPLRPPDAR